MSFKNFSTTSITTLILAGQLFASLAYAQDAGPPETVEEDAAEVAESVPQAVEVMPAASDGDISGRLEGIMLATGWFEEPSVHVDDGVVFLSGTAVSEARREWIVALTRRTESVTAVVNNMTVQEADLFDLSPALDELKELGRQAVQMLPKIGMAIVILVVTWFAAVASRRIGTALLERRVSAQLLRQVPSNVIAFPVLLIVAYIALRVSGLT